MRVMASGLGPALAFLRAKGEVPGLLAAMSDWVLNQRGLGPVSPDALLGAIVRGDSDFLRRATDEALAYLQWVKRFAEAEIGDEEDGDVRA